ncbi:MAG: STAS domain-containing protein [Phycisphaerales bacterium]|nr:STAS domain-containing protein [Phycisphaerales bacterium]
MPEDTALIQSTEFSEHGAVIRVCATKLHEHESSLLIQEMKAYLDSSDRNLIVADFQSVEFISSAGLGAMVTMNTELAKRGGRLVMINLSDDAMQVIKLTKLDKLIPVEKSLEKAQKRLLK